MGTPPSSESDVHVTARADNDRELSRQYLSISWWLLEQGSRELLADILAATHVIFDSLSPRTKLTVAQFRAHVTSVTCEAEAIAKTRGGEERWLPYLLPRSCYDHSLSNQVPDSEAAMPYEALLRHPQLQALLDETADIIESPGFGITNTALIDYSLELLIRETPGTTTDGVTRLEADRRPIESLKNPQGISMEDVSTTLAALVISTSKTLIHHLETGQDSYLGTLFEVPALKRFSATVFSSNMSHKDQSMQLSVAAAVSKKPEAPSVSSETYLEQRPSITQEDEGTDFDSFQRAWTSSGASRHIL